MSIGKNVMYVFRGRKTLGLVSPVPQIGPNTWNLHLSTLNLSFEKALALY